MDVHSEIQELLFDRKFERLASLGEGELDRALARTDERLQFSADSCLKKAAILIEALWADPDFWRTVRVCGRLETAADYISTHFFRITADEAAKSFTNVDETFIYDRDIDRIANILLFDRHMRQRFFSQLLATAEVAVRPSQDKGQRWFRTRRKDIIAVLQRYLEAPRNFPKRYILRKLSSDDWNELHLIALDLADDTESLAHGRTEFFPDFSEAKAGRKRESETAQKIEWMADALCADTTLSDSELARRAWKHFNDPEQKKLGLHQTLKAAPGRMRKLAGVSKALVENRHGLCVTHHSKKGPDGKRIGRNLPRKKNKPAP